MEADTKVVSFTAERVSKFLEFSGDTNPIHFPYRDGSVVENAIVPGVLIVLECVLTTIHQMDQARLPVFISTRFRRPLRIGESASFCLEKSSDLAAFVVRSGGGTGVIANISVKRGCSSSAHAIGLIQPAPNVGIPLHTLSLDCYRSDVSPSWLDRGSEEVNQCSQAFISHMAALSRSAGSYLPGAGSILARIELYFRSTALLSGAKKIVAASHEFDRRANLHVVRMKSEICDARYFSISSLPPRAVN